MKNTWASGALELLHHADSHIEIDSAFDSRIAFISIDNSIETIIRTYIALPQKISGFVIPKKELDDVGNSFPKMVDLLFRHASHKLVGLNDADIEHYHRIRNQLYHDGTGLSVDKRYLLAYRQIASVLLNNLFGIDISFRQKETNLENLILLWNEVEKIIRKKFNDYDIDMGHTFKWEIAMKEGILSIDDVKQLTELRMIRNKQVHSTADDIDASRIALGVKIANNLLEKFKH